MELVDNYNQVFWFTPNLFCFLLKNTASIHQFTHKISLEPPGIPNK